MSYMAHMRDVIAGLVHESARGNPAEAARHRAFISVRLLISLMTIIVLPPYLALRGGLVAWEAIVVCCAMTPLLATFILSRTGNFVLAQSIAATASAFACLAFAVGTGGLSAPALVWLVLTPVEAMFSLSVRRLVFSSALSLLIVGAIVLGLQMGWMSRESQLSPALSLMIIVPAFLYATLLSFSALRLNLLRGRLERQGVARYQTLASVMGDVVMRHTHGGAVTFASRECETIFGLPPREFSGRGLFEHLMVQDRPLFLKTIADAEAGKDTVNCSLRLRTGSTPSGHGDFNEPVFSWVELRARRIETGGEAGEHDDGAIVMSVLRDISAAKRHEQEIEAARIDAERANAWKDRFLANISHELRTPLNAIIGFSEILGNEELMPTDADKRREYATIIHDSGQHLLEVVNSILDISKMEAGRFHITTEPFDLPPLIDSCCDIVSLRAAQGNIELKRDFPAKLDELIADKRALKQVLINLLGNAIKFTPAGGRVTVGARQDGAHVSIFVSDTGCGMSPYDLPRLGGAFFQAGSAEDRTYEGTGLGLSVVRGLVGLHGGEISIESGLGLGTTVSVRMPMDCSGRAEGRPSARIIVIPRGPAAAGLPEINLNPSDEVRKSA